MRSCIGFEDAASREYDAIVIGSGVGGLVLAALLGKVAGKKVLVLESHYEIGGFTHRFQRRNHAFDVGVHYVGGLQPGSRFRRTLDYLTDGRLEWKELPRPEERLYFSDQEIALSQDRSRVLSGMFPAERAAVERYFRQLPRFARAYMLWQFSECFPFFLGCLFRACLRLLRPAIFRTTERELAARFQNPRLIAILAAQWPGFGLPPKKSSFGFHCTHAIHYAHGSWYPRGGGERIGEELRSTIERCGGRILTRLPVERILVERGTAVGVGAGEQGSQRFLAPLVISNAGARRTYLELLLYPISFRERLRQSPEGSSAIMLFLTLKDSPLSIGLDAANHWLIEDENFADPESCLYLSFPSLKRESPHHTAEVLIPADNSAWPTRSPDYGARKRKMAEQIIDRLDFRFPGFRGLIQTYEVSTPRTVERFMGKPDGAIFGLPAAPERFFWPWARSSTPIRGLFLTGSDVLASGVGGAAHGALKTFELIQNRRSWREALRLFRELRLLFR